MTPFNREVKIFSGSATAYGAPPNAQANLVDLAYPGVLPVLNAEAVRMAVKFGLAAAKELVRPVTMTGAPAVEFARLREPVLTTYGLADAPDPVKLNGATARPPSWERVRFRLPEPGAETRPDAVERSRRTRPALASMVAFPEDWLVSMPKASMDEPTDTCARV